MNNNCFYSEFEKILIGRILGVIIMYVAGILEKMVKEFCHACTNLRACRRYTLVTIKISKILSKLKAGHYRYF